MSPTERTLKSLRDNGWTAEVVERWIPGANIRKDLFSIIDIVAIQEDMTLGVQCTSDSNLAARIKKITECPLLPLIRKAGWGIEAWGWRKGKDGKWQARKVDLS